MFDALINFFDRLCGAKGVRGVISSVLLIIITASLLFFYESYSRHFLLNRMGKEVELLHKLEDLAPDASHDSDKELIADRKTEIISMISAKTYSQSSVKKENLVRYFTNYSLSMVYWVAIAIAMRREEKKKGENKDSAIVMIFFGAVLSFITSFFKRRFFIMGHLIFYPTMMILAVALLALMIALPFMNKSPNQSGEGLEEKSS